MELIDLELFVSVVDHGSVVAAAAALQPTQSPGTQMVQELEDALWTLSSTGRPGLCSEHSPAQRHMNSRGQR